MSVRHPLSDRLYAALLRLYPAEFRREYGVEMAQMFRDVYRAERRRRGLSGGLIVWLRAIREALVTVPEEHMDVLWQDIRYGLRSLWNDRAFSLVAIIALALGAGANTAIFSLVDGVLLRPLPIADQNRLVWVETANPPQQIAHGPTSTPDFEDWRAQSSAFERMAAFVTGSAVLDDPEQPERVPAASVSVDFFDVLRVNPIVGRTFAPEECVYGGPGAVVLAESLWRRRYAGDPAIVGRTMSMSGRPATVVGIVPDSLQSMLGEVAVWRPLAPPPEAAVRSNRGLSIVGRLAPGHSIDEARSQLSSISKRLESAFPKENANWLVDVVPLREAITRDVRGAMLLLLGAVGFVLLIACANVANLLLARGSGRSQEMSVRAALGASRTRVIRQLVTESVLLYVAGGVAGLAVAGIALRGLVLLMPTGMPLLSDVRIDGRVLLFTFGVSLAAGLLFGLAPAIQASKADLNDALKQAGKGAGASRQRNRARSTLVVSEIALACVLVTGAALFAQSFARLHSVRPGFDPTNVVTARVTAPRARYATPELMRVFFDDVLARVRATPGVSASMTTTLPLDDDGLHLYRDFIPQGRPEVTEEAVDTSYANVDVEYFAVMRTPLLRGRLFDGSDRADGKPVVIVNESLARRIAPDGEVVGRTVHFWHDEETSREIVGVVADVKTRSLARDAELAAFVPFVQDPFSSMVMVARSDEGANGLGSAITSAVHAVDSGIPVYGVRSMDAVVSTSMTPERVQTLLLGSFAVLGMLLAMTGVYAVMWYVVTQRRREIGIRIALGARPRDVLALVVTKGVVLALVGVAIGATVSLGLGRAIASFLFGTSAADPLALLSGAGALVLVAVVASSVPAWRASGTDPLDALRDG